MKKTIILASVAIATLFAFSSCQKENLESNYSANGLRIVTAEFENNGTKTTLNDDKTPQWAVGDIIRILNNTSYQDVTLAEGNITDNKITFNTDLQGDLYAVYPASATTMTNCSGSIDFTIPSTQDGTFASANICVAKGDDKDNLTFRNATAVLKITTATDVVGVKIEATNNIAGSVTASFSGDEISLTQPLTGKTVSAVCKSAPSDNVFYLAAVPVLSTGSTTATCYTIDKKGSAVKESKELLRNVIYSMNLSSMIINTDCDLTGTKGTLNGHEYVIIKCGGMSYSYLKWATRNIDATGDTGTDSYGTYFAWGETTGHALTAEAKSQIASPDFVAGTTEINNAFESNYDFGWSKCPYAVTTDPKFNKYVPEDEKSTYGKDGTFSDDKITLDFADDAANKKWGGSWRMPTSAEFQALKDATYWKWEDGGYYVYAPQSGDAGKTSNDSGVTGTYDDVEAALLFFPAAGNGDGALLRQAASDAYYWSSSLRTSTPYRAYSLYFDSSDVYPQDYNSRYGGFSVRPVSD